MDTYTPFGSVLKQYVDRAGFSSGQLARLSGIPRPTLVNWITGRVSRPRERDDLLKLAAVLHLDHTEATRLLQSAGYTSLYELAAAGAGAGDAELLALWADEIHSQVEQAPFQAVPRTPHFVSRAEQLAVLKGLILDGEKTVLCLHGMAGAGKTTLAAHLAYELRYCFPEGVLWARLDRSDTMSILGTFAEAYGRNINFYQDVDSRSRVVRELLADKRVLMVLDNATSSREIQPLLPPTGRCVTLITTRRHNLWATCGAQRFEIGPFSRERRESLALFRRVLGENRTRREEPALTEIADLLGHLPLAVVIAASRLAHEAAWSTDCFLERVREERRRLDLLAYEDESVRLSFQLSYDVLTAEEGAFFDGLGVFATGEFTLQAAACVNRIPVERAEERLRTLHALSLVQTGKPGCFQLHPLLHDLARANLQGEAQTLRMVDYFTRYVEAHEVDHAEFDHQLGNIHQALRVAYERGMWEAVIRGAHGLHRYLEVRGMHDLDETYLGWSEQAARALGDASALAKSLYALARQARHRGDLDRAERLLAEGLSLTGRGVGIKAESKLYGEWGVLAYLRGDYHQAEVRTRRCLDLARRVGCPDDISSALSNLGAIAEKRGDAVGALACFEEGLVFARQSGCPLTVSALLTNLGTQALVAGDLSRAEACFREGLDLVQQAGNRARACYVWINLADLATRRGDRRQARAHLQTALATAREICSEDSWVLCAVLNAQGEACLSEQDPGGACSAFSESLAHAGRLGAQELTGVALFGLARAQAAAGEVRGAAWAGRESLAVLTTIEHRRASEVRAWLAALSPAAA